MSVTFDAGRLIGGVRDRGGSPQIANGVLAGVIFHEIGLQRVEFSGLPSGVTRLKTGVAAM
jgi:hypothetical protein